MSLSDTKARNAKPVEKQFKLYDTDGMYLLVTPNGGKCWRLKYRFQGKEKLLALGTYPEVSLLEARQRRDEARKQLSNRIDPGAIKKAQKAARGEQVANSFDVVAREWHSKFSGTWSAGHAGTIKERLEKEVFPYIGARPIADITTPEMLAVLSRMESRGALGMAHRVRNYCSQIFRFAVATCKAERDIASELKGALAPVKFGHMAAPTDPKDVAPLLRAIDEYKGYFVVKCALRLAPLLFVRPGELRQAEWAEIDFETEQWNIPGEKMKMKAPHVVPLSRQAMHILRELQPLTGHGKFVFPCARSFYRPMSNNGINSALRRMGFDKTEITGHGFRAMARTILDEVLQVRSDIIEHQLAHAVRDPNGRAYNRTSHLAERREMMQTWADYLDGLKSGVEMIPLKRQASEKKRVSAIFD
jgi:integrase